MLATITATADSPYLKVGQNIEIDLGDVSPSRALEIAGNLVSGGLQSHVGTIRSGKKKGEIEVTAKYGCSCFGREIPEPPQGSARPVALSFAASADAAAALIAGKLDGMVSIGVGEPSEEDDAAFLAEQERLAAEAQKAAKDEEARKAAEAAAKKQPPNGGKPADPLAPPK